MLQSGGFYLCKEGQEGQVNCAMKKPSAYETRHAVQSLRTVFEENELESSTDALAAQRAGVFRRFWVKKRNARDLLIRIRPDTMKINPETYYVCKPV